MQYTVLHIYTQLLFWAGNQGNHQNFYPSLLAKRLTDFHGDEGWVVLMIKSRKPKKRERFRAYLPAKFRKFVFFLLCTVEKFKFFRNFAGRYKVVPGGWAVIVSRLTLLL